LRKSKVQATSDPDQLKLLLYLSSSACNDRIVLAHKLIVSPHLNVTHLAALAIEHGATLCTNDRDFARFPGLRVEYPLQ
jgi:predicted nucleic acid-binding protein